MKRALVLLPLALFYSTVAIPETVQPESVILLHGLGRSDRSMRPLEKTLTQAGFEVHNLRYASRKHAPEQLVADISRQIDACCAQASKLHFVGHSLGGILIRAYLAGDESHPNPGRVVMLAPPNGGSELVDVASDSKLLRWGLGPTGEQLGTDPDSFPNRLPPPSVEVGVIAGTFSMNAVGSSILPGDDDGTVSLERTKLEGMTDFITVRHSHTFIMRSDEVGEQVVQFLRRGQFSVVD